MQSDNECNHQGEGYFPFSERQIKGSQSGVWLFYIAKEEFFIIIYKRYRDDELAIKNRHIHEFRDDFSVAFS